MKLYRLKACGKCGGDLARDYGDWICLQCGTYYYVGLYLGRGTADYGPDYPAAGNRPGMEIGRGPGESGEAGEKAAALAGSGANWPVSPICWAVTR